MDGYPSSLVHGSRTKSDMRAPRKIDEERQRRTQDGTYLAHRIVQHCTQELRQLLQLSTETTKNDPHSRHTYQVEVAWRKLIAAHDDEHRILSEYTHGVTICRDLVYQRYLQNILAKKQTLLADKYTSENAPQ